jgi:hypothetical protein
MLAFEPARASYDILCCNAELNRYYEPRVSPRPRQSVTICL